MTRFTLTNGLTLRARAYRLRGAPTTIVLDVIADERTRAYDQDYHRSIRDFQDSWRSGVRGDELTLPVSGAEAFLMTLRCTALPTGRHTSVPLDTRQVGGTGTEWRVRWDVTDPAATRFSISDQVGAHLTTSAHAHVRVGRFRLSRSRSPRLRRAGRAR